MSFLTSITAAQWAVVLAFAVVGALALYGLVDKTRRSRTKEDNADADEASGNLIKILQTTVDELTKKVDAQTDQIGVLEGKVGNLEAINKTLSDVLQGRDKAAVESQALVKETHDLVKSLSESMTRLATTMEGFMKGVSSTTTINKIN